LDNFRIDLKDIDIDKKNWVDLAQDWSYRKALVNVALDLWIP
jgi:hypothetical protein